MLVSTIYDKVDVIVDSRDLSVSEHIRVGGSWEAKNLRTVARLVKKGDTVLNVGSHVGLEAMVLGRIVGDSGKLFIFEPYSVSHNMVLKNVYLNKLSKITTVYNVGAGNKYSIGYIYVNYDNTGASIIFTDETIAKAPEKTELVEVDLVDNVLPSDAVIDFALLDAERF